MLNHIFKLLSDTCAENYELVKLNVICYAVNPFFFIQEQELRINAIKFIKKANFYLEEVFEDYIVNIFSFFIHATLCSLFLSIYSALNKELIKCE